MVLAAYGCGSAPDFDRLPLTHENYSVVAGDTIRAPDVGDGACSVRERAAVGCSRTVTVNRDPDGASLPDRVARLVRAIADDDEPTVEAVLRFSRSRRAFAPLAFAVGAFAMLLDGLRLLLSNWRLMLVELPAALWLELAMLDLKAHVLGGKSLPTLGGSLLIPIALAIVLVTAACFFLNAVFAFATVQARPPAVRQAVAAARLRLAPTLAAGAAVGALLAFSMTVAPRLRYPWFTLSLGIVVAVMMVCYVAVPSRLVGLKATYSKRDKLTATVLVAALATAVCIPPYLLGRLGIVMLGSRALLVPGILVLSVGFVLEAGVTGTVRAVKMSATLAARTSPKPVDAQAAEEARPHSHP